MYKSTGHFSTKPLTVSFNLENLYLSDTGFEMAKSFILPTHLFRLEGEPVVHNAGEALGFTRSYPLRMLGAWPQHGELDSPHHHGVSRASHLLHWCHCKLSWGLGVHQWKLQVGESIDVFCILCWQVRKSFHEKSRNFHEENQLPQVYLLIISLRGLQVKKHLWPCQ